MNLNDLFAEEETKRLAEHQREEAARKAAWDALTPEQQAAEREASAAAYEAKWGALLDEAGLEDDEDEDDDLDEDD